ncbi:MAG TPA: adenylyltransferase/cytidyltransferase family protein [Eggerthellaceae bacterium]|nr:adenylyltransferase/cytidyltransferase family protein [Eggerthellaceae bacterium]
MAKLYKVDESFDHSLFKHSSCAFGVFDGVHLGHQYLLSCAKKTAQYNGGKSIALTFDIDPDEIFHPNRLRKLMSNERRLEALLNSGVDAVVALPFTKSFSSLSPEEFLRETFNGYAPSNLHVGLDFHFGAKAAGSVADLAEWGAAVGTHIDAHNLQSADGAPITATRIRLLLMEHDLDEAQRLLGRRFSMVEKVRPGRGEGADMGFSTANLFIEPNRRVLAEGVYSAYATVEGKRYRAAVSMGVSPVFADKTDATCEVHILDFDQNIYGEYIEVEFVEYLRPMIKFDSTEELIKTVMGNIDYCRNNLPL